MRNPEPEKAMKYEENVDVSEFYRRFGLESKPRDFDSPAYVAYRVIQGHMDYVSQLRGWGDDESAARQLAETGGRLDENGTGELVGAVGAEKARAIADYYGLALAE